ncbi:MAG: HlyD family type I secretion periplasmic adaptor subunit [Pseudomonadota bacterium]
MTEKRPTPRLPLYVGYTAAILLVGGIGFWSVSTEIAGAVVTSGAIEVESESQVVQHPDGGVIDKILVRNGDTVTAGDMLVRLDGTFLRSELAVIEGQLAEIFARSVRLRAERDELSDVESPEYPDLFLLQDTVIDEQLEGQIALFEARKTSIKREDEQLTKQQGQIQQQIEGLNAQLASVERQLALFQDELEDVETLYSRGLIQASRLLELQRAEAEREGQIGGFISRIAEAETRISEIELQSLRLADERREEAIEQLRDLAVNQRELLERRGSLVEQLGRLDIVAPVSGVVFGSQVFAEKSVLQPAAPVLYIVPSDQPLRVVARVEPIDVDQIYAGQEVALVFSAFNRRTTPEGVGTVRFVSADATIDQNTGMPFYEAIVTISDGTKDALSGLELVPGMPVEAFIKTDDRTPLTYLVQPLSVYFARAFREE